jgi:hypothetical protein
MNSKAKSASRDQSLSREYYYASHHHLIPLYVLVGINMLAILVTGCFLAALWQNDERDSYLPSVNSNIRDLENLYLPAFIEPAEKKQYLYPAGIRFALDNPYDTLRYSYDPAAPMVRTANTYTITTTKTLQDLETPMLRNPKQGSALYSQAQQCARLYVVRFEPGVTTYGGFVPLQDVKLKDGRTAYIHKNTSCVPQTTQAMNNLDAIEKIVLSVESY